MLGMDQMYKMALDPRIFPDQRLLAIMQGKDQSLPMAVAMAAKQQRDKLHQAAQGQQAQQGAKQPTVKDQMLAKDLPAEYAEHAGLAALPAENMQGMGEEKMMAGGGIVAFEQGGFGLDALNDLSEKDKANVKNAWLDEAKKNPPAPSTPSWLDKLPATLADRRGASTDAAIAQSNADAAAQDKAAGVATPTGLTNPATITPQQQAVINAHNSNNPIQPGGVGTPPAGPGNAAAAAAQPQAGIGQPPQRVDSFAGLGDTQDAFDQKVADEKRAATGDFLMNMGLKMMTTVGPLGKAVGEGGMAGLPSLAASRKSINELEKNRNDYRLNMAKAQTAADEGDQDLALKYKTLAEQSVYHSGLVAADMIKSNAYAAGVGSKSDIRQDKLNEAILKGATDLHAKNMTNPLFATKFAKMDPTSQQQYFAGLRNQASALAGQEVKGDLGSGFSMDAIDAAIARKEKSKS